MANVGTDFEKQKSNPKMSHSKTVNGTMTIRAFSALNCVHFDWKSIDPSKLSLLCWRTENNGAKRAHDHLENVDKVNILRDLVFFFGKNHRVYYDNGTIVTSKKPGFKRLKQKNKIKPQNAHL